MEKIDKDCCHQESCILVVSPTLGSLGSTLWYGLRGQDVYYEVLLVSKSVTGKEREAGLERGKLHCNDSLGHPLGKSGGRMAHQVSPLKWLGLYTPP